MENLIRKQLCSSYKDWNPVMRHVTGRYADGSVREVSYSRLHRHGGFLAVVTKFADRQRNVNLKTNVGMYFPCWDPAAIASWMAAYYASEGDVVGMSVTECRSVQPEKVAMDLEKMVEHPWRYGYSFFEI